MAGQPVLEEASAPRGPASLRSIPRWMWALVLAAFLFVYGSALFSPALFDDADATHAEVAREMAVSGDLVTLHIDGIRYLEKAPALYWLVAASYKIFGISEFSARLPIFFSVLALIVLAMQWASRAFGALAGGLAGLFVVTSFGIFLFSRILIPEALLSIFLALCFYFFLRALDVEGAEPATRWRWYAVYALLAAAVLAKGLVALIFFGGTASAFLLITGDWRRWREFQLFTGLLLFLVIAAPWHLLAGIRNHGFFWFYFVNEHFLRFLGRRYPKDYNKMPAWAYWGAHIVWLFPWSLFLPLVIRNLFRRIKERSVPSSFADRTRLLCAIWAALILVFFSISTNQEYYTFPAYLPMLILLADSVGSVVVSQSAAAGKDYWFRSAFFLFSLFCLMGSIVLFLGLWRSRNVPFIADIGNVLVVRGVGNYTLSMSHFFDLTTKSFAALRLPAGIAASALLLGSLGAFMLKRRRNWTEGLAAIALTCSAFLFAAHVAMERFEPYLSSHSLAKVVLQQSSPTDHIMVYGDQAYGSSFIFYIGKQLDIVDGRSTSLEFGSRFPDAPKIFLSDADLLRLWKSEERQFLFVPGERRRHVEDLLPEPRFLIIDVSGKQLYTNRAN